MKILIAIFAVLGQIEDSYLRYLPLSSQTSKTEFKNLAVRLLIYGILSVAIYKIIFDNFGISAASYKAVLMIGWLPFFLIFIVTIRRSFSQHIFILGMSALWIMLQHNWISILDALFLLDKPTPDLLLFHSVGYVAISVIALPFVKRFFSRDGGGWSYGTFSSFFRRTPARAVHCLTSNFYWRRTFLAVGRFKISSFVG